METYQKVITQFMYDKQLDSGKGTLLHLCDDVIQQEVSVWILILCLGKYLISDNEYLTWSYVRFQVKEVIISFFILMEQGKATLKVLLIVYNMNTKYQNLTP